MVSAPFLPIRQSWRSSARTPPRREHRNPRILVTGPRHNVHVRVTDPDTGRSIPVRIRFTDQAGNYYAPYGRLSQFERSVAAANAGNVNLDGQDFAYIDGQCEIFLPGEPLRVQIERGPEYRSLTEEVRLG